jgi:hypothetical protein
MPGLWIDFVNPNKAAESQIAHLNLRRAYEAGRTDATETIAKLGARRETAVIDSLIQDAVAQRVFPPR